MPRKRRATAQPLGELLGLKVPAPDKEAMIRVLDGLPPIAYWAQCKTIDQKQHYIQMKQGYQFLKEELQRFFSGQGSLMPRLSEGDRNFFGALRDRYLAWYGVVQTGWKYIEDELSAVGMTAQDIQAGCPGEALIRILENECAGFMQPAFLAYSRYSPSQDRRLTKTQRMIGGGKAEPEEEKRYETQTRQNFEAVSHFFSMTDGMIDICEKHSSKDKPLEKAIKTYRRAVGELDREIQYQHRERLGRKGHEWKSGSKDDLSRG